MNAIEAGYAAPAAVQENLEGLATQTVHSAAEVVGATDKFGLGVASGERTDVEKVAKGALSVTQTAVAVPAPEFATAPGPVDLFELTPPVFKTSSRVSTKEIEAPARATTGRPDLSGATLKRNSVIETARTPFGDLSNETLEQVPSEEIPIGAATTFSETVSGEQRDVQRTVTVGQDKSGEPLIRVEQSSTDKTGQKPRKQVWVDGVDRPSETARRVATGVAQRVAAAQPAADANKISM